MSLYFYVYLYISTYLCMCFSVFEYGSIYLGMCLCLLASYFLFFVFISFILLLVPSCVFLLFQVSFAFGPSLLAYLFWGFSSSSPSFLSPYSSFFHFHSSSSLCLRFLCLSSCFIVSCSFLLPPAALSCFSFPLFSSLCLVFSSFVPTEYLPSE